MVLGHIERGTRLDIYEELDQRAISDGIYEAEFRYMDSSHTFVIRCNELYERFDSLNKNAHLCFTFMSGPYVHTFTGFAREKQRNGILLIEMLSDIETHNRRQFDRDEIRVVVKIYRLAETDIEKPYHEKPVGDPLISDMSFDISIGGMCVITSTPLTADCDPYYLVEFSMTDKDYHLLPTKLVRRSNNPRSRIGKYDYGFQFLLDHMPAEMTRLTKGIINRKIYQLKK